MYLFPVLLAFSIFLPLHHNKINENKFSNISKPSDGLLSFFEPLKSNNFQSFTLKLTRDLQSWPTFLSTLHGYATDIYICPAQPVFTCSKLTIETLEQGVKYVQS